MFTIKGFRRPRSRKQAVKILFHILHDTMCSVAWPSDLGRYIELQWRDGTGDFGCDEVHFLDLETRLAIQKTIKDGRLSELEGKFP